MESAPLVSTDQKIADEIYNRIKASVIAKRITAANVTIIITMAMTEVERLTALPGEQKKALVVYVITRLVGEIPADQADRAVIQAAVALLLPSIIDTVVAAASGKYPINTAQRRGCCAIC